MSYMFLDWGIGGLSVYRVFKEKWPQQAVIYISDSGFTPYGTVSADALRNRVGGLITLGRQRWGVKALVVACNAASTIVPDLQDPEIVGMIEAGVSAVLASGLKEIGVIGGKRTIESGIFSARLRPHGISVTEVVAQPLSALIERGVLSGGELDQALCSILPPLKQVEGVLLACTHYPAIVPALQQFLPGVRWIDPAPALLASLKTPAPGIPRRDAFYTTGDPEASARAAELAFGVRAKFERIEVPF